MIKELEKYGVNKDHGIEVEEVKIQTPNGIIAGKWWGSKLIKPILCLHGWQDNAGSFDRIIPLLPRNNSYLAIDFPGHGYSCKLPNGVPYFLMQFVFYIADVVEVLKLEKISLICHSMGAWIGFIYASSFADKVKSLILIEGFATIDRTASQEISDLARSIRVFNIENERNLSLKEPPSYRIEEIIQRVHDGSFGNIAKESAPFLIARNIKRTEKNPDKFCFTRDGRLKGTIIQVNPQNTTVWSVANFKIPFLLLNSKSAPMYAKCYYFDAILDSAKKNDNFTYAIVDDDSHYPHMNEPEKTAKIISKFLLDNMKLENHL